MLKPSIFIAGFAVLSIAVACDGVFDGIYDEPSGNKDPVVADNQLIIDASSWTDWYYLSFDSLQQYVANGDKEGLRYAQTHFTPYPVPLDSIGTIANPNKATGIYTYWFDVFGKGMDNNALRWFRTTVPQPEPAEWDIAFHRQNVRTNGATVLETNYTSIDDLPSSSATFTGVDFVPDEWSEKDVWSDETKMLLSLIGCQGIKISKPLSSMLIVNIPPMPPTYGINHHVFLVKLKNGNVAAIQLANYMNSAGKSCYLTINYKYPY